MMADEPPIISEAIAAYVSAAMAEDYAAIEEAVEGALQGGECGVLVIYRDGRVVSAGPDPSVPYGVIHEYH